MDSLVNIVLDGNHYPSAFTILGLIGTALFISVQIFRTWIKQKLLSELMSPIWSPVAVTAVLSVLVVIDHLRAVGVA